MYYNTVFKYAITFCQLVTQLAIMAVIIYLAVVTQSISDKVGTDSVTTTTTNFYNTSTDITYSPVFFRRLRTTGGLATANGDYSASSEKFGWTNGFVVPVNIMRILITIEDAGTMDTGGYGNGITLTNGIMLYLNHSIDGTRHAITDIPVITNADWASYCYDQTLLTYGSGSQTIISRWTFARAGPEGILMETNDTIYVELGPDDFSGLLGHVFVIQGYIPRHTTPTLPGDTEIGA